MSVTLRKKIISKGRTSLYLDIYFNGSRHYESLKLYLKKDSQQNKETLQLAKSIASKRQLEIQNNEHGFISSFKKKANFIEYFEKIANGHNPKSDVWLSALIHLKGFEIYPISFSSVNEQWLEQFQLYLLKKVKTNTAKIYFSKIKHVLTLAVKEKIIQQNPANNIAHIKNEETQRTYLSIDEVKKLAATNCNNTDTKNAFLFSCFTGLRFSDVQALTWENIRGNTIEFRQQKTKSVEYMPMSDSAIAILKQVATKNGVAVLPLKTNKIFNFQHKVTVYRSLQRWAKDAGITKHISYHTSRHTCGTMFASSGVDVLTISKMLGHKDIATTLIYAKVVDAVKQEAVNKLPRIEIAI